MARNTATSEPYRAVCLEVSAWLATKGIRKSPDEILDLCPADSIWPLEALVSAMREDSGWPPGSRSAAQ